METDKGVLSLSTDEPLCPVNLCTFSNMTSSAQHLNQVPCLSPRLLGQLQLLPEKYGPDVVAWNLGHLCLNLIPQGIPLKLHTCHRNAGSRSNEELPGRRIGVALKNMATRYSQILPYRISQEYIGNMYILYIIHIGNHRNANKAIMILMR